MRTAVLEQQEQRMDALRRANEARLHRAAMRRALRERAIGVFDAMDDRRVQAKWRLGELLICLPQVGERRARDIAKRAGLAPERLIGELTTDERMALGRALEFVRSGIVRVPLRTPDKDEPPRRQRQGRMSRLPAGPLADAVTRYALKTGLNDEGACKQLGICSRNFRAWKTGDRAHVSFDVADRALIGLDLLWWEVWDQEDPAVRMVWEGPDVLYAGKAA